MRILKWLLGIVVVLGVAFVGGAYLLPREVAVARTTVIDAAPEAVFPHVNSMKATEGWSPWLGKDPNVQLTYNDVAEGVGARMEWASEIPEVGSGTQEITASIPNEKVETALDFGQMGTANASFTLVDKDGQTEITWGFVTDTGFNPMARWFGVMMDGWVGGDYETGLSNLKTLVEG